MTDRGPLIPWRARPELRDRLCELWPTGMTALQIARELGYPGEKNAIIGQARRLGLSNTKPWIAPSKENHPSWRGGPEKARHRRAQKARAMRATQPSQRATKLASGRLAKTAGHLKRKPPPKGGVSFADHRHGQCKWPITDGAREIGIYNFRFCGAGIAYDGCPWCPDHDQMAHA